MLMGIFYDNISLFFNTGFCIRSISSLIARCDTNFETHNHGLRNCPKGREKINRLLLQVFPLIKPPFENINYLPLLKKVLL